MKSKSFVLAAPTAKLILGQSNSIELDTATTSNGQQAFNIKIVTDKDTILSDLKGGNKQDLKELVEVMMDSKGGILHESKEELATSIISIVSIFILIPAMIIGYLIYKNRQKQKLYQSMIEHGINPMNKEMATQNFQSMASPQSFKYLKYGVIVGAIGSSFVISSLLDRFLGIDTGLGLLLLFLGGAFFYLHRVSQTQQAKSTVNTNTNNTENQPSNSEE
jgi:hypothetical protein